MPLKLHSEKKSAVLHHYKNDIRPLNGDLQEKSFMDKSVWSTFVQIMFHPFILLYYETVQKS